MPRYYSISRLEEKGFEILDRELMRWDSERAPRSGIWLRADEVGFKKVLMESELRRDVDVSQLPDYRDHYTPEYGVEQWNLFVKIRDHEQPALVWNENWIFVGRRELTFDECDDFVLEHGLPRLDDGGE